MSNKLKNIVNLLSPQTYLYLGGSILAILIAYVTLSMGYIVGGLMALMPFIIYIILYAVKNPYMAFAYLFVANYFVMGLSRYFDSVQGGLIIDALILFNFGVLLIRSCYKKVGWSRAANGMTVMAIIWLAYCLMELMNPTSIPMGWVRSVRGIAVYFLCISVLTPIIFYKYKDLKRILRILSVLTLMAILKAYIQKNYGFDPYELRWLYVDGGKTTHIIYSGTRYFSIYSDAASFGAGMGFAMVVFSLTAIYVRKKWLRAYYLVVALAAAYGMIISGTRSAFIIPLVGYALYILISKNYRIMIIGTTALIVVFVFLKFTYIGHDIAEIRRMRSAFSTKDASFQVRLENQKAMAKHMVGRPFGTGIGMGGVKAREVAPNAALSNIPTDSWFVMIWVETGIVGLILHISILLSIVGYGCYLVVFRIKDPQLRGILSALNAGVFGIMVASYGNEIYGQLPTAIIVYMSEAFIFMGLRYDKEIAENKQTEIHEYEIEA